MFLASNFLGGPLPEFLKSIYKIQSDSDHVVKFQGDRSRELGERVAKQKKTSGAEYKPIRNGGSGRPKKSIIMKIGYYLVKLQHKKIVPIFWGPVLNINLAVNST